ncbi:unnamed protein product, partial [Effrenium voratum]
SDGLALAERWTEGHVEMAQWLKWKWSSAMFQCQWREGPEERLSRAHCRSVGKAMCHFKDGNFSGFCEALAVGGCQDAAISVTLAQPQEPDCPLIGVSKGFQSLSGYRRDEVLGRNCRFLNRGCAIRQEDRLKMRAAARAGKSFSGLLQNRKKSGETFANLLCINSLRVGCTFYLLGIQVDMTRQEGEQGRVADVHDFVQRQMDAIVNTISEAQQDTISRLQVPFDLTWLRELEEASAFAALETQCPGVLTKNTFLEVQEDEVESGTVLLPRAVSDSMLQGMEPEGVTLKILKDQVQWLEAFHKETPEQSEQKSPAEVPSRGSQLHPDGCTPCSFHCYSLSGCNQGEDCSFCHLEHLRRPKRRSKKKKDEKEENVEKVEKVESGQAVGAHSGIRRLEYGFA